jgi:UDP-GlcNAc:undecaprenyl-phosphate GlcNAc-1-phosphate transferase
VIFLGPFVLSILITYYLIHITKKYDWVYRPQSDRWNTNVVSLHGGVGIWLSFIISVLLIRGTDLSNQEAIILVMSSLMMFVGLFDDINTLMPKPKLLFQFFVCIIAIFAGVSFQFSDSYIINAAVTIFWIIGINNAVNLMDNMDGASPGLCLISVVTLSLLTLESHPELATMSMILGACLGGFLLFNFNPAQIFMGDSGSLFLGSYISMLLLSYSQTRPTEVYHTIFNIPSGLLLPAMLVLVPILDTTFVSINRYLNGYPISQGDKGHITHRLSYMYGSDRLTIALLYSYQIGTYLIVKSGHWKMLYPMVGGAVIYLCYITVKTNYLVWPDKFGTKSDAKSNTVDDQSLSA